MMAILGEAKAGATGKAVGAPSPIGLPEDDGLMSLPDPERTFLTRLVHPKADDVDWSVSS